MTHPNAAPTANGRQRPNLAGWGHPCPTDPAHGRLLGWPGERGWYCPHQGHGGNGAFFTTAQAERTQRG